MVTKKKIYGSVKRLGVRYGRRIKERLGKIEALKKTSKLCPFCRKEGAKRLAAGIWHCKKCGKKFAGGAYTIGRLELKETEEKAEAEENKEKSAKKADKTEEEKE